MQTVIDCGGIPQVAERAHGKCIDPMGYEQKLKRIIDVLAASFLLIFLLPLMVAIYLIVRLDGGPAFFRHCRVGQGGREFHCLKYRTMVVDAEMALDRYLSENRGAQSEWERDRKLRQDPRVTPIGAFLRKSSLDELPQLVNVLRGEMSLVGPRPIVRGELPLYGDTADLYMSVRPGITGIWQVSGRNNVAYDVRVEMDAMYVKNLSLLTDMTLLVRTVPALLRRRGAY